MNPPIVKLFPFSTFTPSVHSMFSDLISFPKSCYIKSWIISMQLARMRVQAICSDLVANGNAAVTHHCFSFLPYKWYQWSFWAVFQLSLWPAAVWLSFEGRAGGGFLSGSDEQVCKLNLGRFYPPQHSWQCDWSVSWLLEIIGEARIWQQLLLFLLSPPLSLLSILPGDSVTIHLRCMARVQSVSDFFFYPLLFNIIFLSPVLVHNHISSSIDRLFCLIFHCHCICAVSGFLILWYGCRDQSVMLPVSESERAHLLFGCYLFVTNAKTHTRTRIHTRTMQEPHALSFPHYHSHITHSLFSCSDTLPFPLTRAFCQFLGSAAVICCCHLTCLTKCANPYA